LDKLVWLVGNIKEEDEMLHYEELEDLLENVRIFLNFGTAASGGVILHKIIVATFSYRLVIFLSLIFSNLPSSVFKIL